MRINCADCGVDVPNASPVQRYCATCSSMRNAASAPSRRWVERIIPTRRPAHAATLRWDVDRPLELRWYLRFALPYSEVMSKNAIFGRGRGGHVFIRKESKQAKERIARAAHECADKVVQNRVWVDLFVQKPSHKSDAINVVDLVCDGLKVGLGIDDRWFSIRRVDWQVVRVDPQVYVGVGQEDVCASQVCSFCGDVKPLTEFSGNRSNAGGHNRYCKVCVAKRRALMKRKATPRSSDPRQLPLAAPPSPRPSRLTPSYQPPKGRR